MIKTLKFQKFFIVVSYYIVVMFFFVFSASLQTVYNSFKRQSATYWHTQY